MKKLFFLLLLMIPCISFAQGNLQYNATKYIPLVGVGANIYFLDTSITVPANKVWKIEQFGTTGGNSSITINGSVVYSINSTGDLNINSCPLWLPTGTYAVVALNSGCITCPFYGYMSVIEFNIVP